ncbi:hypothetical protein Hanom_Chr03g00259831 [Helianthus anomalus]
MRWLLSLAREMVILEGIHLNSLSGTLLFFGRGIRNNSGRTLGIVTWLLASNQIQSSALPPGSGGLQKVWCSSNQIQSSMVNVVGRNSNLLEDLTSIIRSIRL